MAVTPYKEESPGNGRGEESLTGQFNSLVPMLRSVVSRWVWSRDGMDVGVSSETGALKV
jgi:hypothetical protein